MYLEDIEIDIDDEHLFPYTPLLSQMIEYSDLGRLTNFVESDENSI